MKIENVNYQGRVLDFYVSFTHDNAGTQSFGTTDCTVWSTEHGLRREEGEIVGEGFATKVPGDQYCKETGRKYALTRALASLPRPVRSQIWASYWARKNQPVS
jgi:hypothetical protein